MIVHQWYMFNLWFFVTIQNSPRCCELENFMAHYGTVQARTCMHTGLILESHQTKTAFSPVKADRGLKSARPAKPAKRQFTLW